MSAPLLQMQGITKSFFGVEVLHGVDLDLQAGEVHALVGENGAGKSTLMKTLAGVLPPDSGTVRIDGQEHAFHHPRQAQAAGVSIIYQEFNLLPERTVAENVFLGREPCRAGLVDRRAMDAETNRLLADIGETSVTARDRVGSLSVPLQQVVETVKALSQDARIIIMDEPTAALAEHEVSLLYSLVRRLTDRGIGVLYVSHRLREVLDLSDRITVLKDGARVITLATRETSPDALVAHMVGRELGDYYPPRATADGMGDVRLRVTRGGNASLRDIDLEVHAGEILGIAGLQGSGRTELARAVFGVEPFTRGEVHLDGERVRLRSPRQAIRAGLGFVTEDRKAEGLALRQSVRDNAFFVLRSVFTGRRTLQRPDGEMPASPDELLRAVEVRARGPEQEVRYLSGGNQQKVVLAKWLAIGPRVLLFDEPTRGIDVGAKAAIHDLMRDLTRRGVAVLMISSELPELIGLADRVLMMRGGTIAGELPAGSTEETIMRLATGASPEVAA